MHAKKTNKAKILAVVLALVLMVGVVAGGTLAWLMDTSDPVINTFTYGDIDIELIETTGTEYPMIPGNELEKNPTVTVKGGSEECWLFIKVEKSGNFPSFLEYEIKDTWMPLAGYEGVVYVYKNGNDFATTVPASDTDQTFEILKDNKVTVSADADKAALAPFENAEPTLTFTAYAVQRANVEDAVTAWGYVTAA